MVKFLHHWCMMYLNVSYLKPSIKQCHVWKVALSHERCVIPLHPWTPQAPMVPWYDSKSGIMNERKGPKMDWLILKQDESGKHNLFWRRKWTHHNLSSYFPPNSLLKLCLFTFRHGKHTPNLKGWHFCCAHRRPWKFTNQAGQLLFFSNRKA